MRTELDESAPRAIKLRGQISQRAGTSDRIAQRPVTRINGERIYFRDLARMAWPDKTEFWLAEASGVDPRTCRRWLAGDNEPPADILGAVLSEIMRRYGQR